MKDFYIVEHFAGYEEHAEALRKELDLPQAMSWDDFITAQIGEELRNEPDALGRMALINGWCREYFCQEDSPGNNLTLFVPITTHRLRKDELVIYRNHFGSRYGVPSQIHYLSTETWSQSTVDLFQPGVCRFSRTRSMRNRDEANTVEHVDINIPQY